MNNIFLSENPLYSHLIPRTHEREVWQPCPEPVKTSQTLLNCNIYVDYTSKWQAEMKIHSRNRCRGLSRKLLKPFKKQRLGAAFWKVKYSAIPPQVYLNEWCSWINHWQFLSCFRNLLLKITRWKHSASKSPSTCTQVKRLTCSPHRHPQPTEKGDVQFGSSVSFIHGLNDLLM